jgi:hypothetical protein
MRQRNSLVEFNNSVTLLFRLTAHLLHGLNYIFSFLAIKLKVTVTVTA